MDIARWTASSLRRYRCVTLPAPPPARLSDGVVVLRLLEERDWMLEQAMSQDGDIVRWTTVQPSLSEEQARERVNRAIGQHATNNLAIWVIERDGESQGTAGLFARPYGAVELFYALLAKARGGRSQPGRSPSPSKPGVDPDLEVAAVDQGGQHEVHPAGSRRAGRRAWRGRRRLPHSLGAARSIANTGGCAMAPIRLPWRPTGPIGAPTTTAGGCRRAAA